MLFASGSQHLLPPREGKFRGAGSAQLCGSGVQITHKEKGLLQRTQNSVEQTSPQKASEWGPIRTHTVRIYSVRPDSYLFFSFVMQMNNLSFDRLSMHFKEGIHFKDVSL